MNIQPSATTKRGKKFFLKFSWRCLLLAYIALIVVFACIYKCCHHRNPQAFYIPADLTWEQKRSTFYKHVQDKTLCGLSAENINESTLLQLIDEVAMQPEGATATFKISGDGQFSAQVPAEHPDSPDVITIYAPSSDTVASCDNKIVMWAGNDRVSHPLGDAWAAYYTELFLTNGYDSYCITSTQEIPAPVKYGERRFPLATYQLLVVEVKNKDSDANDIDLALLFDSETFDALWKDADSLIPNGHHTTVRDFYRLLPYCLNNLDDTRVAIKASEHPPVLFADFLYFSIITITTTGYGDILPNATYVRCLVAIEILLGTIIFGLFLAGLSEKLLSFVRKER